MPSTIDLLKKAADTGRSNAELSRALGLDSNTLAVAKSRGALSPEVAGPLALELGLDPEPWTMLAVADSAKHKTRALDALRRRAIAAITMARNS
jgi:plasmid maintenance system antidote protein VapI